MAISFVIMLVRTSFSQSTSCLEILPNPNTSSPAFQEFDRFIEVLGVLQFYAEPGVSDAQLLHAASIGAELLDNNEDGLIDDDALGEQLSNVNATMPLFLEEGSPAEEAMMDNFDDTFCVHAVLYSDEIAPDSPLDWFSEACLEEILHTINGCGHTELCPAIFALWPAGASQLAQASLERSEEATLRSRRTPSHHAVEYYIIYAAHGDRDSRAPGPPYGPRPVRPPSK